MRYSKSRVSYEGQNNESIIKKEYRCYKNYENSETNILSEMYKYQPKNEGCMYIDSGYNIHEKIQYSQMNVASQHNQMN